MWLTYKDLKPVSTTQLRDPKGNHEKIFMWLKDAGLYYLLDEKEKDFIYLSKDAALATRASKIMWSRKPADEIEKGSLFGYPELATKSFVEQGGINAPTPDDPEKFLYYWWPYARYIKRVGHFKEDTIIAKKWADTIRKDTPKLAEWFENEIKKAKVR